MPRKKDTPVVDVPSPVSLEPEPTAPAKTSRSRRKPAEPSVSAPAPEVQAAPEPKTANRSRAAKKPVASAKAPAETPAPEPANPAAKKPPARTAKTTKAPVAAKVSAVAAETPVAEEAKKPTRAKPAAKKPTKAVAPVSVSDIVDEDGFFVVLEWRQPTPRVKQAAKKESQVESPATVAAAEPIAPRKSNRRRRGGKKSDDEAAPTPQEEATDLGETLEDLGLVVAFRSKAGDQRKTRAKAPTEEPVAKPVAAPEPPLVPVKPPIPIPEDAPQVILRNGIPTLVRNKKVYPPIMFFGSATDEKRAQTVLDEIRLAGESGVHVHTLRLDLEVDPREVDAAAQYVAYMLGRVLEADAEAEVMFRVVFEPPRNWETRYPNALYRTGEGDIADPSICDDDFWSDAEKCLVTLVKKIRMVPHAKRILGVHIDRAEWFAPEGHGFDVSKSAVNKFREWTKARYSNDEVTLRAAWFDGHAGFENIAIPPYHADGEASDKFIRSSRKQRRYVDYHLFLSDITVSRIGDLAYAVKEASEGYFLVGASYGYTFEWSHPASGHLALGKLLRQPFVDFIAGPPSYRNREPGGTAPFPGPVDSVALNGKLYISEEDFKTSLSGGHEPDDFNTVIKTPQALDSVHWRGAGAALAHGGGTCWMDLWGNGWLRTASIWQRASAIRESLIWRMSAELKDPDVIVFIDERALAYLVDSSAFTLLVQNVRESVLRSGLSAGFYLLSDLAHREKFPEGKLYIFLNAWDIRPDYRAAIKTRLQKDGKVLFWLYAAGLFDGGRESLERAREITGIALKPQPYHSRSGTSVLHKRHPLCEAFPDRGLIGGTKLEPSYFAIPEEAMVLGEYTQTGLPSFVVKEFKGEGDPSQNWTSVFLGEPIVSASLIRALGQMAGAHVYDFQEDVVHAGPPFLSVHCHRSGPRTITLPPNWSAYNLQSRGYTSTEGNSIRFNAVDGSTHTFAVGPREELEAMVNLDPAELLKIDELPAKELNTIQTTGSSFDVPILKLGDYLEGGLSDEAAEDWLLRPPTEAESEAIESESESPRSGRRRRRRRGGRPERGGSDSERGGSEESVVGGRSVTSTETIGDDDFEMNVVFRKRD